MIQLRKPILLGGKAPTYRPHQRQPHVLVRIPDIPLLAVVGVGIVRGEDHRESPFEELVKQAEGKHELDGGEPGELPRYSEIADADLPDRADEER